MNSKSSIDFSKIYLSKHPREAALDFLNQDPSFLNSLIKTFDIEVVSEIFKHLPSSLARESLKDLPSKIKSELLNKIPTKQSLKIISQMNPDEVLKLEALDITLKDKFLKRKNHNQLEAASLLIESEPQIKDDDNIKDALEKIKNSKSDLNYIYITNTSEKLVGVLTLHELLKKSKQSTSLIHTLMKPSVQSLLDTSSLASLFIHNAWRKFHTLPVIDSNNTYLGYINYRDLIRLRSTSQKEKEHQNFSTIRDLNELFTSGFTRVFSETYKELLNKKKAN